MTTTERIIEEYTLTELIEEIKAKTKHLPEIQPGTTERGLLVKLKGSVYFHLHQEVNAEVRERRGHPALIDFSEPLEHPYFLMQYYLQNLKLERATIPVFKFAYDPQNQYAPSRRFYTNIDSTEITSKARRFHYIHRKTHDNRYEIQHSHLTIRTIINGLETRLTVRGEEPKPRPEETEELCIDCHEILDDIIFTGSNFDTNK